MIARRTCCRRKPAIKDVRWAEITDDSGHGVRVKRGAGAKPFAMSLLPYSSTMLEEALHQDELPKPRHMFLRLLAAQMGVGGDDSWMSPVHEQYQLPADQPLSLNVRFELFSVRADVVEAYSHISNIRTYETKARL